VNQANKGAAIASPLAGAREREAAVPIESEWLCTNHHAWRLSAGIARLVQRVSDAATRLLWTRVRKSTWLRFQVCLERYGATLATLPPPPEDVKLEPLSESTMTLLREHPCCNRNQLKSGLQFWRHGLRNGYIWMEEGEPMCFLWLFLPQHNGLLRTLPGWAGMYPPLPPGWGQLENTFTFGRGLRRPGGAATDFAHAVMYDARERRLCGLIMHIHEGNLMARRWAQRTGCRAYGTISRYHIDFPLLRRLPWFIHRLGEVEPLGVSRRRLAAGRTIPQLQHGVHER
jgi:hypothetical protein